MVSGGRRIRRRRSGGVAGVGEGCGAGWRDYRNLRQDFSEVVLYLRGQNDRTVPGPG